MEVNTIENWATPPTDVKDNYIAKCRLFVEDDAAFANFKRDPDYQKILEGNDEDMYQASLKSVAFAGGEEIFKQYFERFKENDSVGNPLILNDMSSSTLRYVSVALYIHDLLGGVRPKRILEIGGGYGGLCKTLSVLYDYDTYTIVDLPEAEALATKYLSHFKELDGKINHTVEGEYDLFIADASLAECSIEAQREYAKMAQKCPFVYILYNTLHVGYICEQFQEFVESFSGYEIRTLSPLDETGHDVTTISILSMRKL